MRSFAHHYLMASAAIASVMVVPPAHAQERTFDIPAQSAAGAIAALGRQADVKIIAARKYTHGKQSSAVRGSMTVEQALAQLLGGTGLVAKRSGAGVWTIVPLVTAASGNSQQAQAGRGLLTGTVRDHNSGSALKGALVEVVETGEKSSTGDLGEFRFAALPLGDVTLRISYLGFPQQNETISMVGGMSNRADIYLGAGVTQEIVVIGQVSARAQALNQERSAENSSTVISSDLLGEFGGQAISETLRRSPGVTFQRDQATGEGTNISVRGLDPDMNAVTLNGIKLPVGNGFGRSASLGNIQSESIEKVTINKTLLPNQDSAGAGGLVEIETKSPLDRKRRFASFSLEGGKRGNGFNDEYAASGTVSARFGADDNFGVSASIQYQRRSVGRIGFAATGLQFGEYLPLQVDGSPIPAIDFVDPRRKFPFEEGADGIYQGGVSASSDLTRNKNLTATLSAAWQPSSTTKLRLDYQTAQLDQSQFLRNSQLTAPIGYGDAPRPVVGLGGEERYALGWNGELNASGNYNYIPSAKTKTHVLTFRGSTDIGRLETEYSFGYTVGSTKSRQINLQSGNTRNGAVDPAFIRSDLVTDPVEGRILSLFPRSSGGPTFPALTEAGLNYFNNSANVIFLGGSDATESGRNARFASDVSLKYNFASDFLRYVEIGGQYEVSRFRNGTQSSVNYFSMAPSPITFNSLGLEFDDDILRAIGLGGNFSALSFSDLRNLVLTSLPSTAVAIDDPRAMDPGTIVAFASPIDPLALEQRTRETSLVGYLQMRVDIGNLEVIGGARFSQVRINARSLLQPSILDENFIPDTDFALANTELVDLKGSQFDVLPRVLANYRATENLIFRAGYFMSVSRPQVVFLTNRSQPQLVLAPFYGPNFDKPFLFLTQGNPNLKPSYTHSFDIGAEYYDKNVGVAKINFFYKRIANLLEANSRTTLASLEGIDLPDDPRFQDVFNNPSNYFIQINIPQNNDKPAHIWGIETTLERRLNFLPGRLKGLGIFANYTYARSKKTEPYVWSLEPVLEDSGAVVEYRNTVVNISGVAFNGQAKHSGTAGISYSLPTIEARVSYTMQSSGTASSGFLPYGQAPRTAAFGTLDARLEYRLNRGFLPNSRFYVEGYDLLRGPGDAGYRSSLGGQPTDALYYGGRQIRVGFSASF